jgi:hypothetical protein
LVSVVVTGGISSVQSCSPSATAAASMPPFPEGVQWQVEIQMLDAEGLELLTRPPVGIGWLAVSWRHNQLP